LVINTLKNYLFITFLSLGLEELRLRGEQFIISDVGVYLGLGFKNLRMMDIDLGQRVSFPFCIQIHYYV
jgi:hypothetical protein